MASAAIYDAIKAYLSTAWTTTPIRWENEKFVPPIDSPWIAVEMTGTVYGQESIGAETQAENRWDEEGMLWLHCFVPIDTGGHTIRTIAKQLADLFRGLTLINGDLEFRDAFIGRGHNGQTAGGEDGNYYKVTTSIKWRRVEA